MASQGAGKLQNPAAAGRHPRARRPDSRLFPIFRDREELNTATSLSASIQEALAQSADLIVLCSPAAAQSRWVNQEILLFKKLGRADRIHALIVDGDSTAGSGDGCFPPALLGKVGPDGQMVDGEQEEPLAADLRPDSDGKDDAKLKLIARMLGVSFNSLRRREAAAARRRLRVTQAVLYQTETARFVVIFPAGKHPSPDKIQYSYFDTKDHPYQGELQVAFESLHDHLDAVDLG
jgi:eukaryotic-like serine/threonine-protein kinase